MNKKKYIAITLTVLFLLIVLIYQVFNGSEKKTYYGPYYTLDSIPEYTNSPYVVINNDIPEFSENDIVDGEYLYNRCHLIGYQLTAENKNEKNLITGTRYMNVKGMLKFENKVASYINETKNHVMYRATPIYSGDNLLANGVHIEAKAIEDKNFYFNVYVYNVQPGIVIDYRTGESYLEN